MIYTETKLKGAFILDVNRMEDDRGFYGRAYCKNEFQEHGLNTDVVQSNVIYTKKKRTLRGLHLQLPPLEETKLVRCTKGAIYDVIIDLRKSSSTFMQWIGVELTADNFRMLYVPEGFAHGYITLEDETHVAYHVTQFYSPGYERGIRWDDPMFKIDWPVQPEIVSEKDKAHPFFSVETVNEIGLNK